MRAKFDKAFSLQPSVFSLTSTFLHIRRVGYKRERALWRYGIQTWADAHLLASAPFGKWAAEVAPAAAESERRLSARDALFFAARLPAHERWRLYREFAADTAYLDIETNWRGDITVVGILYGGSYRAFIRGRNLGSVLSYLRQARVVATYFGAAFDLPVLSKALRWPPARLRVREDVEALFRPASGVHLPWAGHVDLCPILHRLGIKGGLKASEQALGIRRPDDLKDLRSEDAPRLWEEYMAGRRRSLDLLVAYNRQDVVNLEKIIERILPVLEQKQGEG